MAIVKSSAAKLYAREAAAYDQRWAAYTRGSLDRLVAGLAFIGGEAVLDVPCGTGELACRLFERWPNLRMQGVDLSPEMLRVAAGKLGDAVPLHAASADALPFPNAIFDAVVCANSFHYFADPAEALNEFRRVLRPGGALTIVDWCDDDWACKVCGWWWRVTNHAVRRVYAARQCRHLLEAAGFEVTRVERFRVGWLWGMMTLHSVADPHNHSP
jgi:ubiquinone/menaquinone biosynthesis C-methylase UbiE